MPRFEFIFGNLAWSSVCGVAIAVSMLLADPAHADQSIPNLTTGSFRDSRTHAECLDYSANVMRVLGLEQIKVTQYSVFGQSSGTHVGFVIRCETSAKAVFFAAAGNQDGNEVEGLLQVLMRQFEITKDLPKCKDRSSLKEFCQ
jgi:hypothetical protein